MFYSHCLESEKDRYKELLKMMGALSHVFSDSNVPYLYYRAAEAIFCQAFNAENISRADISIDAKKGNQGIGLKTFRAGNGKTLQKITEFGAHNSHLYWGQKTLEEQVRNIAILRNRRMEVAQHTYGVEELLYHCVIRDPEGFTLTEEPMRLIDVDRIHHIQDNKGSIHFTDGEDEYSFLRSKNTLTKRFVAYNIVETIPIDIISDPWNVLKECLMHTTPAHTEARITLFLPLYGRFQTVFEHSGLNQWNAQGRDRHLDEAYIPIPAWIHRSFPTFFPNRETPFDMRLPNGSIMRSKVCQANAKALMSQSNRELGHWILRDVLAFPEGKLVTYADLEEIGIDSVRIDKIGDSYRIDFAPLGSYEAFKNRYGN